MPAKIDLHEDQCSMFKRLAAAFYDSLCLFSLFFLATLILMFFTNGESVTSNNIAYDIYLALITYLYFTWHWVNGGQTLGMRAWRIKLKTQGLNPVSWSDATRRFVLSLLSLICFGLGFAWAFLMMKNSPSTTVIPELCCFYKNKIRLCSGSDNR